jgi:hypothetical protein
MLVPPDLETDNNYTIKSKKYLERLFETQGILLTWGGKLSNITKPCNNMHYPVST